MQTPITLLAAAIVALESNDTIEALRLIRLTEVNLELASGQREFVQTHPAPRESWLTINEPEWTIASGHDDATQAWLNSPISSNAGGHDELGLPL